MLRISHYPLKQALRAACGWCGAGLGAHFHESIFGAGKHPKTIGGKTRHNRADVPKISTRPGGRLRDWIPHLAVRAVLPHLRRHVRGGAAQAFQVTIANGAGRAEVGQLYAGVFAGRCQQQVPGLQVAVAEGIEGQRGRRQGSGEDDRGQKLRQQEFNELASPSSTFLCSLGELSYNCSCGASSAECFTPHDRSCDPDVFFMPVYVRGHD